MKIAIVVHGRFHAFDMVRALLQQGHGVSLFTNYPKWAVKRFGVPASVVCSFWLHGVVSRLVELLNQKVRFPYPEERLHRQFGRWVARQLTKETWDVVHSWSGISEELLSALKGSRTLKLLMRGSTHIRTQARILEEEEKRTKTRIERPSDWMIAREEREYALADRIVVLSNFARQSFITEGIPQERLLTLHLGVQLESFRPISQIVEARCKRILSGKPLRVLYIGAISLRKGFWDMANIIRRLAGDNFRFRLVGTVTPETSDLSVKLRPIAEFIPKQPQQELPNWYAWGDLFVFPTIEEGYALVLAQAYASALPILTTTNCSGPELIRDGETGWVLPIRNPEAFIDKLCWCNKHRQETSSMVHRIYQKFKPRDWTDVAQDFESLCIKIFKETKNSERCF